MTIQTGTLVDGIHCCRVVLSPVRQQRRKKPNTQRSHLKSFFCRHWTLHVQVYTCYNHIKSLTSHKS